MEKKRKIYNNPHVMELFECKEDLVKYSSYKKKGIRLLDKLGRERGLHIIKGNSESYVVFPPDNRSAEAMYNELKNVAAFGAYMDVSYHELGVEVCGLFAAEVVASIVSHINRNGGLL